MSETVYLSGKFKYARTNQPDQFGKYSTQLYLDDDSFKKVIQLQTEGVKNTLKKDEEGYYISIGRPVKKTIKGKEVLFDPPELFDAEGKAMQQGTLIGNGTEGTAKLSAYNYNFEGKKGKAMRLDAIKVTKLVPYGKQNEDEVEPMF